MKKHNLRSLCALAICGALVPSALAAEPEVLQEVQEADVTWEELDGRIEQGSLNFLILTENIQTIEAIDYEKMKDGLRTQLNGLADLQWYAVLTNNTATEQSLSSAYSSLRETFDTIYKGDLEEDNADAVRQLQNAARQIVSAGENLYINLVLMDQSAADGQRGLATLDRSLKELRLRQKLGQVSEQTVQELEQTRASTESQLKSLESTIKTYKSQLQTLMGEEPTGELTLGALPDLTGEEIRALDYEADLAAAKEQSWTLYSAKLTLDDAKKTWRERSGYRFQYEMADHTWNAAQITYQSAVQDFETAFDTLYRSISNYQQIWENKQEALSYQEKQLAIAQAKYDRGMISYSALQSAQDGVEAARSEVKTAQLDLFTALNNYHIAVEYGILN